MKESAQALITRLVPPYTVDAGARQDSFDIVADFNAEGMTGRKIRESIQASGICHGTSCSVMAS